MDSQKGNIPINTTAWLIASTFAGAAVLFIIVPILMAQKGGNTMCIGPWKSMASLVADMTGATIC